ncbi:ComEA family DNA-binding protein [Microbacterium sp. 18062]|uniref:ComEA family DNA-binding protein n=1 Tax=Microbacterium sp. 18062 TaxID=2681410 RepID=UPI001F1E3C75|nr:ComEA family DNA-binding protein [Microbacterium sp. 18062]
MTSTDPVAPHRARARLGAGAVVAIVLVALAVTVAIGMFRTTGAPEIVQATTGADAPEVGPGEIYVHVSGAVSEPGLYRLVTGARVFDAVAAAGGLLDDADLEALNLARAVADGEQVRVPVVGETPPGTDGAEAGIGADGRIDLNAADAATLERLPRVGPAIAARIIEWRDANGRFTSVEDLRAVPGIGDKMLAALRDLVTV